MRTLITTVALGLTFAASAQSYNDLVEIVRSDIRTEHRVIVLANMQLTDAESALFNPIYDQYTVALKTHWDKNIALIKDYAAAYERMDDETAKSLMTRSNTLEKEGMTIRETYAKKMMKVLPATTATRWLMIERRLNHIVQLQLADEIPLMPKK